MRRGLRQQRHLIPATVEFASLSHPFVVSPQALPEAFRPKGVRSVQETPFLYNSYDRARIGTSSCLQKRRSECFRFKTFRIRYCAVSVCYTLTEFLDSLRLFRNGRLHAHAPTPHVEVQFFAKTPRTARGSIKNGPASGGRRAVRVTLSRGLHLQVAPHCDDGTEGAQHQAHQNQGRVSLKHDVLRQREGEELQAVLKTRNQCLLAKVQRGDGAD